MSPKDNCLRNRLQKGQTTVYAEGAACTLPSASETVDFVVTFNDKSFFFLFNTFAIQPNNNVFLNSNIPYIFCSFTFDLSLHKPWLL